MKTNPFNDFWRGKEVKTEPSKIQKSDFKTLWKGGEAALAKGAMDELKNYIQLRLDQNIPQDKALDQAIAVNGRLPEMKRLDPSEVETLVDQVYNKTEKAFWDSPEKKALKEKIKKLEDYIESLEDFVAHRGNELGEEQLLEEAQEKLQRLQSKLSTVKSQVEKRRRFGMGYDDRAPNNDQQISSQIEALYPGKVEAFGDDGAVIVNILTKDKELAEIIKRVIRNKYYGKLVGDGYQAGYVWLDGDELG